MKLLTLAAVVFSLAMVQPVAAQQPSYTPPRPISGDLWEAILGESNLYVDNSQLGRATYPEVFMMIIYFALVSTGVVFIVLIVYGGYLWLTAWGSDEQIRKAKDIIRSAITGLVVIISAYWITFYIIRASINATINIYTNGPNRDVINDTFVVP